MFCYSSNWPMDETNGMGTVEKYYSNDMKCTDN